MKYLNYILLCISILFTSNTFALEQKYHEFVLPVIASFKTHDKPAIAAHIRYPLKRQYPLPDIKNEAEFINRFDEVFDEELVTIIGSSNINTDWGSVGWRGIMLNNGVMWVDTGGKIIGINSGTSKEQTLVKSLIEQGKQSLHLSVNTFKKPVLDWKTAKYHIRVDDLGEHNFRYAVWGINKKLSDKPSMALLNGDITFEGSGGNYHYTFKNCRYSYVLQVAIIGCYYITAGWL
ncbi:hypothetical protein [Pseudoalteromonas fuliginea]|uniref:Uncharacterized protein n=1 Tax=Pseudoalteromonas fuliginea TaxID=1872678 RepID=A0ABQ6REQ5_9GAMM|nr:hypothetical protein [Pseudoalteromonas fuliginea]KAA1151523.1 hypothetical protein EU509_16685 [Pseudoalteromonas fuliginea]KAA1165990.1 hypothetical protein EUZ79_16675 [Pseudoalteromonas fuliginea]